VIVLKQYKIIIYSLPTTLPTTKYQIKTELSARFGTSSGIITMVGGYLAQSS
jgi:hypothetical protein